MTILWSQLGDPDDECWRAEVDGVIWLLAWWRGRWWLWKPSGGDWRTGVQLARSGYDVGAAMAEAQELIGRRTGPSPA